MIGKEVIADRKAFYVQEGKIEMKNAMDYLNAHCDSWNEENKIKYSEILNRAEMYLNKAIAMDDILKIETEA